ncbi:MAG: GerMN domain-containing protein [Firmicutes bacterium]|nr:GerMN domain-containing protein [Bacillota bacterium]
MRVFAVIILVIALVMGVYAVYEIQSLKTEIKDLKEELKILKEEFKDLHTSAGKKEVLIYLVESTPIDFLLRPVIREVQEVASPQVALDELLAGPKPAEGLISPIPPGTRVLGLQVKDGLATVDFSEEIHNNFNGGAAMESLLLDSIVYTLTEFDTIDQVQILVEGKVIESIGGHVLSNRPLRRD